MRAFSFVFAAVCVLAVASSASAGKKQLKLLINKNDVDLVSRTLHFKINRPADSAEIQIFTPEGELIYEKTEMYDGAAGGTKLSIAWPDLLQNRDNFRLELKVTDVDEYWVGYRVIRFYLDIPHEEVVFESAKWDLRASEEPKLEEPLKILVDAVKKYGKLIECKLYVAGHTDTVGSVSDNRELSQKRARVIAAYFKKNGLKGVPIFVRGFGEESLAVETGDSISEEKNRRVQYILSTQPPEISGPGSWQQVR